MAPLPRIRVLVVDDAVVVRRLVSEALGEDPEIEVVATAANGKIALAKLTQVNPDVVTLDIEMPEMDGLETLSALRKTHPRLPVIMFSTTTERGAQATLDALSRGASDYVTKPSNAGNVVVARQRIREELVPRIKALCGRSPLGQARPAAPRIQAPALAPRSPAGHSTVPLEAVVIGVSTGGPNALAEVFPTLPRALLVPVLVVQHMPPLFTRMLAERLTAKSVIPVREAVDGDLVEPGRGWIAPGGFHLEVERREGRAVLRTSEGPPENSCRPAVDVLFRSAVRVYGPRLLAVVLTGMGQDGLRGAEAVHAAGGQVIVQDEASSVVWGMPGFVARAGLADGIFPIAAIGPEIVRRVGLHRGMAPARLAGVGVGA